MGHIHSNSEYDFTVSAVIVHKNKVLMLLHHKLKLWLSPAGHVELNETPIEALYRKTQEETGLTKDQLTLIAPFENNLSLERDDLNRTEPMPFDIDIHPVGDEGHRHIDLAYIFISNTDKVVEEKGGAEELRWFSLEELAGLSPMPKIMYSRAEYALEKVKEIQ